MPRKFIKRYLPDHKKIYEHKRLRCLGPLLEDPNLLHLNRRSVSGAFAVGLFMAWVPVPFQMLLAAVAAVGVRVNLPISVVLVWISNPLTMPPLFYGAYKLGTWILDIPGSDFKFELTMDWLMKSLSNSWQPFLLGCLVLGLICSLSGFVLIRGLWRLEVSQRWKTRRLRRRLHRKP